MPLRSHDSLRSFFLGSGQAAQLHSLPALQEMGFTRVSRLPVSLRIVLESLLRNVDDERITEAHVEQLANWQPRAARSEEIPFIVARILLQDFTGVPLLCDLAAMRDLAARLGQDPRIVEPLVPVDLVVDHSVQVDYFREPDALDLNMRVEFHRNLERYRFIKWGMQAFEGFRVVPPGIGIVHQVNLEYLARGVCLRKGVYFPDSLVGTDSHTTMINGLGVVGWGVGGIEAEAGMLGQPVSFLAPDVVGVHLKGTLREGVTATDLVLVITALLRKTQVVGKFVEFFGEGAAQLSVPDRATIANMAPEYGATMGFFPPDELTAAYLAATGRSAEEVDAFRSYYKAQQLFGMPRVGDIDYSSVVELDLASVAPSVAGPRRPQDHISLSALGTNFRSLLLKPQAAGGYGKTAPEDAVQSLPGGGELRHGDVLIAAITSCTNTSNPGVMLAAGLLAQKALSKGLKVAPHIKTSLAPGSRVVSEYLERTGLLAPLAELGFRVVAYGCTTCIGNAGPLDAEIEQVVSSNDLICASVLSGNRNFEARIHPAIKANFLMSPPLVVAFALAGRVDIDLAHEAIGLDTQGQPVFLKDIWPNPHELHAATLQASEPDMYRALYENLPQSSPMWTEVPASKGEVYSWDPSTYIARPPFFDDFTAEPVAGLAIRGARALAIFGDSVTTDHISPAGSIERESPAGEYLIAAGVKPADFNSYGSRRGNHEVMMRGTFANVRIRNLMLPPTANGRPVEGGFTLSQPDGKQLSIYDAAMGYLRSKTPTLIFAGEEYGTGSSRDWAAKGTALLGVKAVIARSFERIHRSNLLGMGVLPLQFKDGSNAASLGITGREVFDLEGLESGMRPGQEMTLRVHHADGHYSEYRLLLRIDTPMEATYFHHGGILPYVLRQLLIEHNCIGTGTGSI